MEALTAAQVAALTLYDMAKALQRDIVIEGVELVAKEGGRSGRYRRVAAPVAAAPSRRGQRGGHAEPWSPSRTDRRRGSAKTERPGAGGGPDGRQ